MTISILELKENNNKMSKSAKTKEKKDEYNTSSHLEHCVRFIQLNVKFLGKIEILQKNINWFCATFLQPDLGPNFALIEMKLQSNKKKLNKKNMTAYFRKKLTSLTNFRISQTLISYFSHFHIQNTQFTLSWSSFT